MRLIDRFKLDDFIISYPDSKNSLESFVTVIEKNKINTPNKMVNVFGVKKTSIFKKNKVCIDIRGNKYRLILKVNYNAQVVQVLRILTHSEYDKIDIDSL